MSEARFTGGTLDETSDNGRRAPGSVTAFPRTAHQPVVSFDRHELGAILQLYGRRVAEGEWRDYALDFTPTLAVFSIFRRTSETPLFTIQKNPKLAKRQGMYAVVTGQGVILRRGHDLARVISVLEKKVKLVSV
jgi:hypothetical protein